MSKNVFVTGATGYVGRNIVKVLLARGHSVLGLVRSDEAASRLERSGAQPLKGELGRPESYVAQASACDAIVHAGFDYDEQGNERAETDLVATRALLTAAASGAKRSFVYTASLFRYRASDGGLLHEQNFEPREPEDWRWRLEQEVLGHSSERLKTAVVRLAWVYGGDGGTLKDAVNALARTDPAPEITQNRIALVHVEDVAALYTRIIEEELSGLFHACRGTPRTVGDLLRLAPKMDAAPRELDFEMARMFNIDLPAISLQDGGAADPRIESRLAEALAREAS